MVFSSTLFLYGFLPVTLAGYYISIFFDKRVFGRHKILGNYWLLIMSLLFFSWSQLHYVWIILASILVNYVGAMVIDLTRGGEKLNQTAGDDIAQAVHKYDVEGGASAKGQYGSIEKNVEKIESHRSAEHCEFSRFCLFVTVFVNLVLLFYFKYFDFAIDTVNHVLSKNIPLRNIVLPIGISFFTFQAMSYTCDVFMKRAKVQRNPFKLALYVMLFPQLIAGPIVRYTDVQAEIDDRHVTIDDFSDGARRFIVGLGKKALIANTMAVTVDSIWAQGIENNTPAIAWLGAIAYSLQIYFDFSGYSDMAIGLGRMFGFHFLENFNLPYISRSVTEFWRRWHISLSSWFRDYVYIPLGGNRHGAVKTYRNLFIIFLLTGIWHGAAWHYVFWGIWHGAFMLLERRFRGQDGTIQGCRVRMLKSDSGYMVMLKDILFRMLQHIYALLIVVIGWVFFRADSLREAVWYLKTMLGRALGSQPGFSVMWYLDGWTVTVLTVGILVSIGVPQSVFRKFTEKDDVSCKEACRRAEKVMGTDDGRKTQCCVKSMSGNTSFRVFLDIGLLLVLLLSGMSIVSGTYNPFIYFQF